VHFAATLRMERLAFYLHLQEKVRRRCLPNMLAGVRDMTGARQQTTDPKIAETRSAQLRREVIRAQRLRSYRCVGAGSQLIPVRQPPLRRHPGRDERLDLYGPLQAS
jgi:hypothetical protein